jgi:hypothetical protein
LRLKSSDNPLEKIILDLVETVKENSAEIQSLRSKIEYKDYNISVRKEDLKNSNTTPHSVIKDLEILYLIEGNENSNKLRGKSH